MIEQEKFEHHGIVSVKSRARARRGTAAGRRRLRREGQRGHRFLRGKADIAVLGSETLRVLERGGVAALRLFLAELR